VVGLPVDTDRFAPGSVDPAVLRASLGLHAEFVAVCVGRLSRQKGQRRLAEAWDADPPAGAQLVFVGPGDPADIAEVAPRSFGSGVVVAGAHSDVRPWLWAASVGVQPSLYEGQSVAMAEALACGLPLVMTDVNGAREAIMPPGEDPAGAVVDVSDLEGLMRELNRRRGNRDLLAAESETARDRALRLFAADQAMARIERAYVDALSARSRRGRARKRRAGWWT
jgi:glycosyltransferase involved in cell wall biosynthesis